MLDLFLLFDLDDLVGSQILLSEAFEVKQPRCDAPLSELITSWLLTDLSRLSYFFGLVFGLGQVDHGYRQHFQLQDFRRLIAILILLILAEIDSRPHLQKSSAPSVIKCVRKQRVPVCKRLRRQILQKEVGLELLLQVGGQVE